LSADGNRPASARLEFARCSETHIKKHATKVCALAGVSIAHHKKRSFQIVVVHIPASGPNAAQAPFKAMSKSLCSNADAIRSSSVFLIPAAVAVVRHFSTTRPTC
jgi:hypothetical protein